MHAKRGHEAMDEAGIRGAFTGTAWHHDWKSYFNYEDCRHGLCNAHHCELQFIDTQYQQPWANDMSELLCEIKAAMEDMFGMLPACRRSGWQPLNGATMRLSERDLTPDPLPALPGTEEEGRKRGRRKQTPPRNLLIRLRDFKAQVLAFMYDFRVPFEYNERNGMCVW